MTQAKEETIPETDVVAPRPETVDSGRVRIGGGFIWYGENATRDEVKDSGRAKMGGGFIRF